MKIKSITLDASRMLDDGIMLEVEIMPSINIIKQMGYGRKEIPTINAKAIIDTGAKCSVVDKELLTHLPQQPCISTQVATPFHTVNAEVHNLIFKIPGQNEYFPVQAIVPIFHNTVTRHLSAGIFCNTAPLFTMDSRNAHNY